MSPESRAARIALLYAACGVLWILFSDRALVAFAPDRAAGAWIGQWKGFFFVLATAVLLYSVARRTALATPPADLSAPRPRSPLPLVFAVAVAAILLAGMVAVVHTATDVRDEEADKLRAVVGIQVAQWSGWVEGRRADGDAVRSDAELLRLHGEWQRGGGEADRKALQARLADLCPRRQCVQVLLVDSDGRELLRAVDVAMPFDEKLVVSAQRAAATGRVVDSGLYTPGPTGTAHLLLDVVAPLATMDGAPGAAGAAVVLRFDAREAVRQAVQVWPGAKPGTRFSLFRRDGEVLWLLETPEGDGAAPALSQVPMAQRDLWLVKALGHAEAGVPIEGADTRGVPAMGLALALPAGDWMIAAQIDKRDLYVHTGEDAAWVAVADVLALCIAAAFVHGAQQRRELRSVQEQRATQAEKLRALQLLDAIANGSTDLIYAKDREGRYLFGNGAMCRALGRPLHEILGRDARSFLPEEQAARMMQGEREAMLGGRVVTSETTLTTSDGERCFLHTLGPLRDAQGQTIGMFGLGRDITDRRHQEDASRQWAMAFENTRDGVMITDERGRIQAVNRAFSDITGYGEQDALGHTPALLRSGEHDAAFYRGMWKSLRHRGHWQGEIWNRRRSGELYPEWLTVNAVSDAEGRVTHYVGVFTDITRIKRSEAQLERLAHYDPLTDLPNRRLLQQRLEHALVGNRRHRTRAAVLYIDLDGFKTVNDSLGHPAGDELLVCVAQRLKQRLREEDTLGRLGGDEFLVVMEQLREPGEAAVLARDLLSAVAAPVSLAGGRDAYVTASIGISVHPDDGATSAVEMLRDADAAMYRAKDHGRNGFCFYTKDLNAEAVAKLELEAALSRALERDELALHFQPQVDAHSGRVVGAEALLRWRRNGGALSSPAQFIPIAERSSLILDIGGWVIDHACRQARAWRDQGLPTPRIAVNVAARQFAAGDLDVVLRGALARHGVPAECLELELTESMLMERPEDTALMLQRLKALGVRLSLDDFGTGYSSLGYLQRFPIDALKIDQSFVLGIGRGPDGPALVDAIIALAHRLHLRVVAEGVETAEQRDYLVQQGCDEMQGYHFGRPVSADELQALLARDAQDPRR